MSADGPVATSERPVLVAGAGIGGLTAARALRLRGFSVRVFERADVGRGMPGSGLTIWTNALDALDRIGLADRVAGAGVPLESQRLYTGAGELVHEVPVGRIGRDISRAGVGIRRQALLRVLVECCAGAELNYGCPVIDFRQDADGVTVRLADGREVIGSVLIGADGLRSAVRTGLLDDGPPEPECHMIWRGISDSHEGFPRSTAFMVFGEAGVRAVSWPVGPDAVCWSVSRNGPPWRSAAGDVPATTKSALLRLFEGFPAALLAIISATPAERIMRTDLFGRTEDTDWVAGRVALLGDAAHAMPTTYGQGACQAVEDAVVLADALATAPSAGAGLLAYQYRRQPRVNWIRARVFPLSRYQGWELPLLVRLRNATLRTLPASGAEATWTALLTFDDGTRTENTRAS